MAYRTYRTDGTYDGTLDIAYPGSPSHLSPFGVVGDAGVVMHLIPPILRSLKERP
ncbi:MAG: hypothetical protein WB696_17470 [Chthoniobacterales bacterium]